MIKTEKNDTMNRSVLFQARPDLGVHLILCRQRTNGPARHVHRSFILGMTLEGNCSLEMMDRIHVARPGELFAVAPGQVHSHGYSGPYSYFALCIPARTTPESLPWSFLPSVYKDENLILKTKELAGLFSAGKDLDPDLILSLRRKVLTTHVDTVHEHCRPPWIGDILRYLVRKCTCPLSLDDLEDSTGYSPSYISRIFKKHMGISPTEYQMACRITRAKTLLADGVKATDAALETGFFDQSHLIRNFTRLVGLTPGKYAAGWTFQKNEFQSS
jgi:AraC-like DNA-binding protein